MSSKPVTFECNFVKENQKSGRDLCVLALDSSTQMASVALQYQGHLVYSEQCLRQKSHSEWINGAIDRAVKCLPGSWKDLDLIGVCHGPGSFTGVRVATNVAKALAFSLDLPIMSFDSLEILAEQVPPLQQPGGIIVPVINAFKNMVFVSVFKDDRGQGLGLKKLSGSRAIEIKKISPFLKDILRTEPKVGFDDSIDSLDGVFLCGDGFLAYPTVFEGYSKAFCTTDSGEKRDDALYHPLAETIVNMICRIPKLNTFQNWFELVPVYIRASAAEENRNLSP